MTDVPAANREIALTVNGREVRRLVPVRRLLVDFLRDDLGHTGTHAGCEHGICGACTVLIDGEPARSCITLTVQAEGTEVTTVEGLTPDGGLSPMQQAFKDCHGLQCGFCTPGFIATLSAADPGEHPDDEAIRELLSGNLCRCTGYQHIVDAVNKAWGRD
ncbi:(2Fe-2S)-binding protein [Saccharopolyspora elongata]|uniref:(2Fe-2S)-binding protein n=1 Tax=Saccharopolyspora elongata TaxID=2530387 RepID=A0A4R4Z409_9PSEU|nr:(2Fe-2S)-binding protein [Saccharopolyspora elongata]TDD52775.1 (2Fe-2S)-binding protein [Saccharopolyspora elongata]